MYFMYKELFGGVKMNTKILKTKAKLKFGIVLLLLIVVLITVSSEPAFALRDPAQVYCEALGYNYTIESTEEGQKGLCVLPNGQAVDAGEFLQGKVGQEYSYCQQMGYEIRTVTDRETCFTFRTEECAVCVLEDGTEVEVTQLMGLTFWEGPRWEVANLSISPSTVRTGQNVTVTVEVTNIGEVEGSYTLVLRIDGETEETRELMLGAGASQSVSFTVTRDVPGAYSVHLGGLRGELNVASPFPLALVGGIIGGILAAVIVYLLIRKRKRPAA